MDEAGFETAHIVGNSLGGYVALQLAARGRARTVVALAPAGGWAGDESYKDLLAFQTTLIEQASAAAPHAEAILAVAGGPAPRDAVHHDQLRAHPGRAARAPAARRGGVRGGAGADRQRAARRLEPRPRAHHLSGADRVGHRGPAARRGRLPPRASAPTGCPHADWVELEGVGHSPQLDVPLETAQLILGFTA